MIEKNNKIQEKHTFKVYRLRLSSTGFKTRVLTIHKEIKDKTGNFSRKLKTIKSKWVEIIDNNIIK